jgi:hypothetical protein
MNFFTGRVAMSLSRYQLPFLLACTICGCEEIGVTGVPSPSAPSPGVAFIGEQITYTQTLVAGGVTGPARAEVNATGTGLVITCEQLGTAYPWTEYKITSTHQDQSSRLLSSRWVSCELVGKQYRYFQTLTGVTVEPIGLATASVAADIATVTCRARGNGVVRIKYDTFGMVNTSDFPLTCLSNQIAEHDQGGSGS